MSLGTQLLTSTRKSLPLRGLTLSMTDVTKIYERLSQEVRALADQIVDALPALENEDEATAKERKARLKKGSVSSDRDDYRTRRRRAVR